MKKIISLIICTVLLSAVPVTTNAFEVKYYAATPPSITEITYNDNNDGCIYTLSFTSECKDIEIIRDLMYSSALEQYKDEQSFMKSPHSYLAAKTLDCCEISPDGNVWYKVWETDGNTFSVSLFDDILPCLRDNNEDLSALTSGGEIYIRMVTASLNYSDENTATVFVYAPGEAQKITIPSFRYIQYAPEDGTVLSQELPEFFTEKLSEDIILSIPSRPGYIFDGWSENGEKRIDRIPADTVYMCLTAHWIPMTYEINYKLTTNIGFSSGNADNSDNPVSYTVGIPQQIFDIRSPSVNYTFEGWYLSEDFSGEKITVIEAGTTGDILLYAKWCSAEEKEQSKKEEREEFIKNGKFGDVDSDGKITAADARFVLRCAVGLEEADYEILKRVDYFNTNIISAANARITLRIAVGLDELYTILLENGVLP